ncbi:MAG: hypothetical protein EON54_28135 [Alcaligenaceae bacterium]|nr:MAG: hypothetical protein EON54_28135 [Alcaligenaceae bacterium]
MGAVALLAHSFLESIVNESKQRHLGGLNIALAWVRNANAVDLQASREALERSGAQVKIIGAQTGPTGSGDSVVDVSFAQAHADEFDGLLIPGGTELRDVLQVDADAAALLGGLAAEGKPVGLIDGSIDATVQDFMEALAQRTKESVSGTPDGLPGAAATGG